MFDYKQYLTIPNIIGLILGIIGLVWLIHGIWKNIKINNISKWPKTKATVLSALAEPANAAAGSRYIEPQNLVINKNDNAQYIPRVTYQYRVAGQDHISSNVVYSGQNSYNAVDTKTILGGMSPNSIIDVYYNPNSPSEAYIYNGKTTYTPIIMGLILALLAGYIFWHYNKKGDTIGKTTKFTDLDGPNLTEIDNNAVKTTRVNTITTTTRGNTVTPLFRPNLY